MRIVLISDTHCMHSHIKNLPDGDVLIHAGDYSGRGTPEALVALDKWFGTLPHKHKIFIAGNHDFYHQTHPKESRELINNAIYLQDSEIILEGVKFYGSPWCPIFHNWAFMVNDEAREKIWKRIPDNTDILITHTPPLWIGDYIPKTRENVGCLPLREAVLNRVKPAIHVFGHIHESYGIQKSGEVVFVNASICDGNYHPVNKPMVIDYDCVTKGIALIRESRE